MIVNLCTPNYDPCDSYGRIAHELQRGFARAGYHVNVVVLDEDNPAPLGALRPALGAIFLGYPTLHSEYGALFNVGPRLAVTAFESTKIPDAWVKPLSKCDRVIVPGRFLVDVFKDCGVTSPIEAIPQGVSDDFLVSVRRNKARKPFTFLAIGDRGARKGWLLAAAAFHNAFGNNTDFKLIIKSRHPIGTFKHPNIENYVGDLSDPEMAALYRRTHAMLFPTRGEGYGLPPREYAGTGGVVLATDWGGTADDIQHWGVPLPYTLKPAWHDKPEWVGKMGQWAQIDIEGTAALMRHVVHHYDIYQDAAVRAAGYVTAHYRWSLYAERIINIWKSTVEAHYASNRSRAQQTA